jgi:hypothetical protein
VPGLYKTETENISIRRYYPPQVTLTKMQGGRPAAALLLVVISIIVVFTVPAVSRHTGSPLFYRNQSAEVKFPVWFFNGSFVRYSVKSTGSPSGSNGTTVQTFYISKVSTANGSYTVTVSGSSGSGVPNTTVSENLSSQSLYPAVNQTALMYFNAGKVPPWVSAMEGPDFSMTVSANSLFTTPLGTFHSDTVHLHQVVFLHGTAIYFNATFAIDRFSGIRLGGQANTYYGQVWNNESSAVMATNVPLGPSVSSSQRGLSQFVLEGIAGAVAIVAAVAFLVFLKRKRTGGRPG